MMYSQRFERLYRAMRDTQSGTPVDAIVLNPSPTLGYMSGLSFHLMERPVVLIIVPGQDPALVLPRLEILKAKNAALPLQTFIFEDNPASWQKAYQEAVDALGLDGKRIGVEPNHFRFLEMGFLQKAAPHAQLVSAEEIFNQLRMHKDAGEVEMMRRAVKIAQNALLATMPMIKAGVTERQIASELFIQLLRAGSDSELPFQPIVSGGPHSADPHASITDRPLQNGDLLVIDWGAGYQGYISDLTRTFAIGEIEPEYHRIYDLVKLSNQVGRDAGRPGIAAGVVDQVARKVIDDAGYGQYFNNRVGHGIGLETHEHPYMYGENPLILEPGMAYTVEPGIYLPNRGGVRIEDDMVVTENGAETLSDLPRDLITLG
jgi:Xaa-Pro dipeptidase